MRLAVSPLCDVGWGYPIPQCEKTAAHVPLGVPALGTGRDAEEPDASASSSSPRSPLCRAILLPGFVPVWDVLVGIQADVLSIRGTKPSGLCTWWECTLILQVMPHPSGPKKVIQHHLGKRLLSYAMIWVELRVFWSLPLPLCWAFYTSIPCSW